MLWPPNQGEHFNRLISSLVFIIQVLGRIKPSISASWCLLFFCNDSTCLCWWINRQSSCHQTPSSWQICLLLQAKCSVRPGPNHLILMDYQVATRFLTIASSSFSSSQSCRMSGLVHAATSLPYEIEAFFLFLVFTDL